VYRTSILPAGRRLEKALTRAAEFYAALTDGRAYEQDPAEFADVSYLYRVMSSDIYESYEALMEGFLFAERGSEILGPMIKAREFAVVALKHRDSIYEKVILRHHDTVRTALDVVKGDLQIATGEIEAAIDRIEGAMNITKPKKIDVTSVVSTSV
jgi:hypothetical protein